MSTFRDAIDRGYEVLAMIRLSELAARQLADELQKPANDTAASIGEALGMAQSRVEVMIAVLEEMIATLAEGTAHEHR